MVKCKFCNRELKSERSIHRGCGLQCAKFNGMLENLKKKLKVKKGLFEKW